MGNIEHNRYQRGGGVVFAFQWIDIVFAVFFCAGVILIVFARREERRPNITYQNLGFTWLFVCLVFIAFAVALFLRITFVEHSWIHWLFLAVFVGIAAYLFYVGWPMFINSKRPAKASYDMQ